jgi:hypothetical protein
MVGKVAESSRLGGIVRATAIRLRNWVEGPARSEQKIGPGRGNRNEPGVNEPANATPGQEPIFPTPWKGGGIGRAREDCFLPPHLWGAETYDWHITWGCARNLACPRPTIPGSSGAEAPLHIQLRPAKFPGRADQAAVDYQRTCSRKRSVTGICWVTEGDSSSMKYQRTPAVSAALRMAGQFS